MSCRKGSIANIALTSSLVKAANGDKQLADFLIKQSNIYQTSKQGGLLNLIDGGEAADKLFAVSVNYGIKNPVYTKQFMDNVADSITVRDKPLSEQYQFFDSITNRLDKEYLSGKGIEVDEVKKTLENFAFTMYKKAEDGKQVLKSNFGARGAELLANNIQEGNVKSYIQDFISKSEDKLKVARTIVKDIFATGLSDEYIELMYLSKGREENIVDNLPDIIYYTHIKGGPSYDVAKAILKNIQNKENLPDLSTEDKYVEFLIDSGKMDLDKNGEKLGFQDVLNSLKQAREADKYIYSPEGLLIKQQALSETYKMDIESLRENVLQGGIVIKNPEEKASLFGISIVKAENDGKLVAGLDVFSDYISYAKENSIPLNQSTYNKFRKDNGKQIIDKAVGSQRVDISTDFAKGLIINKKSKQVRAAKLNYSDTIYIVAPEKSITADQKLLDKYIEQNSVITNIDAKYITKEEIAAKINSSKDNIIDGDRIGVISGFNLIVENGKLVISSPSKRRMNDYMGALFTPKEGAIIGEGSLYRANVALQEKILGEITERDNLLDVQKRIDVFNEVTGLAPLKGEEELPELKVGQSLDGVETLLREYLMADSLLPSGKTLQAGEQERVTEALRNFIYKGETADLASYFNIANTEGTILDKRRIGEALKTKVGGSEKGLRPIVNLLVNNQGELNKLLVDLKAGKLKAKEAEAVLVNLSGNKSKIDMVRFIMETYVGSKKLKEGEFEPKFLKGLEQFLDDASNIMSSVPKYQDTKFPEGYFHSGMVNELKGSDIGAVAFDDLLLYNGEKTRTIELSNRYTKIEKEISDITTEYYDKLKKIKDETGVTQQKLADEYRNKIINKQLENRNWNIFPEIGVGSSTRPLAKYIPGPYLIEVKLSAEKTALESISDFYDKARNSLKEYDDEYTRETMFERLAKNGYTDITVRDRRARVSIDDALKYYGYTGTQYMSFDTKSKLLQKEIDDRKVLTPKNSVDAFIKELPNLDGIQVNNLGNNIVLPKMIGNPENLEDAITVHNQIISAFEKGEDLSRVDLDVLDDVLKEKFKQYIRKLELVNANPQLKNALSGGDAYDTIGEGLERNDILTRTEVKGQEIIPMSKEASEVIENSAKEFNDFNSCV